MARAVVVIARVMVRRPVLMDTGLAVTAAISCNFRLRARTQRKAHDAARRESHEGLSEQQHECNQDGAQ